MSSVTQDNLVASFADLSASNIHRTTVLVAMKSVTAVGEIRGLMAQHPYSGLKEKLELFGQFVGDWEGEAKFFNPDGSEMSFSQKGEVHCGWILDGMAVQDVWGQRDPETGRLIPGGTTVRFYDPKIDAWQSIWVTPMGNDVARFVGRKIGEKIVLEGRDSAGKHLRWMFSEIKSDSFTWTSEESKDEGKTWGLGARMRFRRQK